MDMAVLLKLSSIKKFTKGHTVVSAGDLSSDAMYIVLQGTIGLFRNHRMLNEVQTASVDAGDFFGEMTLFLGKGRVETAVALTDAVLIEINRGNVLEMFAAQPDLALSLLEGLCKRMDTEAAQVLAAQSEAKKGAAASFKPSERNPLFPEEHGHYLLLLDNSQTDYLIEEKIKCPICGHAFPNIAVLESRLLQQSKDDDTRIRYKDVEPIYYETVTCPECLFSAMYDLFKNLELTKRMTEAMADTMAPYRGKVEIKTGVARDSFTVFASYYLAIISAPVCFHEHQRITSRLWRNISRVYDDCNDEKMMRFALRKSADEYLYSYSNFDILGKNLQQLCFVIGEILFKLEDVEQARRFLYAAFTNKEGTPAIKRQAENRMEEIKEILKKRESDSADA